MSKEQMFTESHILLSKTNLDSRIKYANNNYYDIEDYRNPHNSVHSPICKNSFWQNLKNRT